MSSLSRLFPPTFHPFRFLSVPYPSRAVRGPNSICGLEPPASFEGMEREIRGKRGLDVGIYEAPRITRRFATGLQFVKKCEGGGKFFVRVFLQLSQEQ